MNGDPKSEQIEPHLIKDEACVAFLHSLFNFCLQHGVVPNAWFQMRGLNHHPANS